MKQTQWDQGSALFVNLVCDFIDLFLFYTCYAVRICFVLFSLKKIDRTALLIGDLTIKSCKLLVL